MLSKPFKENRICLVVACNDKGLLDRNLLASDMVQRSDIETYVEHGAGSASAVYNRGIVATKAPIIVFAHQDVYFPPAWREILNAEIARVEGADPNWAVLAPFGVSTNGHHAGHVWSTSLGAIIGRGFSDPEPAQSFDELVIVMRRDCGLSFDDAMPQFHLYGTDIVQQARAKQLGAYIVNMPVVHNDRFHDRLGADFGEAYKFLRRKWRAVLPLRTPVLWVTKFGFGLKIYRLRAWRSLARRRSLAADRNVDPRKYSAQCGWENPEIRAEGPVKLSSVI